MSVRTDIYGKGDQELYIGCVLDTYEHNGYHDSDFYAVCWDEEKGRVVEVEYDTTRCGGWGYANIDVTLETLLKVYRFYYRIGRDLFDRVTKLKKAQEVQKGDTVVVARGRKVPNGTVGKVFWIGTRYNIYSRRQEDRVGIEVGEEKMFLPLEYVEVIGWENRVCSGKERKRQLVNFAINLLPIQYRAGFRNGKYRPIMKEGV